jgi:glycosyltransferase involved in cell wall biosynthesis
MVASFLNLKDYDTYLQAAMRISTRNSDVTFLCIGDGDDSDYKKMVPENLKGNVLFLGRQNKVESIMNICDVGVLTTNIKFHGEGISNALLEFMAVKKPVVTTNFGGSAELVENGTSGFLIDAFSVDQLVEKLDYLISHEPARIAMGDRGYQIVKEKFSMEVMFNSFQEEYNNVLGKSGKSR